MSGINTLPYYLFNLHLQARKLEEKERDLKRQDEYYKEQLARLEERVSVSNEVFLQMYFITGVGLISYG